MYWIILKTFENVLKAIALFCADIKPNKKKKFQETLGTPGGPRQWMKKNYSSVFCLMYLKFVVKEIAFK